MNALIRKEIRLLLPSFVIGLLLALSIWLLPDDRGSSPGLRTSLITLAFMVSPAMLVMMTLGSFGRELSAGTFSFMLSQPVPRSRVWWTKSLLLAVAVVILWAVWWFSLSTNRRWITIPAEDRSEAFLTAILFAIAAYSGGLWTTLLFRQLAAAFWFTLLTPSALVMVMVSVLHEGDPNLKPALVIVFSIYGVAGFLFARWLFLRAQDTHWTGGEIALPEMRGTSGWFGRRGERRQRRPRAALWAKELQLHQSQFVLAGLLVLMHLAVMAVRKFGGSFKDSPALEFVLENFWVLWLAMPLLVGSAAVAEERKLGTLEGQLCLPSRRRTQFGIKFASALLLSLLLGAALPLLLEGTRILPDFSDQYSNDASNYAITTPGGTMIPIGHIVAAIRAILPFLVLPGIAAVITLVSFYASTLARNTLQALAPALLGIITTWFLIFAAAAPMAVFRYPLWNGWLIYLIGVPVMLLAMAWLMYWNFKRVLVGWNVWRRNALVLLASLTGVATLTSATYHRLWEHFMTLEPAHGATRLPRGVNLRDEGVSLAVQFPNGQNWSSRLTLSVPNWVEMLTGDWKATDLPGTTGYLEGANWLSVTRSYRDTLGIREDGTLWVSERPEPLPAAGLFRPSPNPRMLQLGQDSDWKQVATSGWTTIGSSALLLKTNGTLWSLVTGQGSGKNWKGLELFAPVRLGTESDWAGISRMELGKLALRKTDGRVWTFPRQAPLDRRRPDAIQLDANAMLDRAVDLDGQKSVASTWTFAWGGRHFYLGVGEDGVLRVIARWGLVSKAGGRQPNYGFVPENIPLGKETNWVALADNRDDIVALKADGSLSKLGFSADPITRPEGFTATPLSRHSDWVGLAAAMDGMITLAADGSLWFWAMEGRHQYPSGFTLQPLLAASRRPQLIGNLFASPAP